jgi:SAM-dependent methyltransferase
MAPRLLLNVGCGPQGGQERLPAFFRGPDWREVRLDIDPAVRPDVVASITDLACLRPGSVDAIWSSHNLEHLYDHEVGRALTEFLRVLTPEGFVYLQAPDLEAVAQLIVTGGLEAVAYDSPAGPIGPLDMLYGHRASVAAGHSHMAHRTGFTPRSLERALERAGFGYGVLKRQAYMEVSALAFRRAPPSPGAYDAVIRGLRF